MSEEKKLFLLALLWSLVVGRGGAELFRNV